MTGVGSVRDIVESLTTFAVGDLLGVLILAPPIIFLADLGKSSEAKNFKLPTIAQVIEWVGVLGCGGAISIATVSLNLSESLTPVMLATAWIGLRFGRTAAWVTIVVVALVVFPLTAATSNGEDRLSTHMSVAAVAIAGYLAASFSTALLRAQDEITRRDRMLLHAERLKTLRSMSVAIIHEVSQPLSTLLLEARHLKTVIQKTGDLELIDTAELVEKKTAALANMTRKLREFGSRGPQGQISVDVFQCVNDAIDVLASEFPSIRNSIQIRRSHDQAYVQAQPLELTQCILNLLRNALQAVRPSAKIGLSIISTHEEISVLIVNEVARSQSPDGMGIGLIISRTIIEALGGKLDQGSNERGQIETVLTLPKEAV
jgi:C4-dicarboxylate-specific signal transduction histidine kinase